MTTKKDLSSCHSAPDAGKSCCKVESVVSVDERGQMILPKEIRDKAKIQAGDKLAVITWEKNEEICCIFLIRAEDFTDTIKDMLGPMMDEINK